MADSKISALASGAPAQAGDEYVVARAGANYKLTLTNIAANMPATTIASGNLTFSSTGQRITGDMSNATLASRLAFQNSVTNGNTNVAAIPNGTGTVSVFRGYGASDPTNANAISIAQIGTTEGRISSEIFGTASYLPMTFYTGGSERLRLDASGNVGIGGTAGAASKLNVLGTYSAAGNNAFGVTANGSIPSGATSNGISFLSVPTTAAASFTCSQLSHFYASQGAFGAGSAVTNQFGFYVASTLTGATNNYGFFSDIASGSNRWNFYAAGTAQNYFAGNVKVGSTAIAATNDWSGVSIGSETAIGVADGATITLTSATCGAVMVHVYDINSGNGGVFFGTYSTTVTKVAGDGEATDTGSTFAVYKSAGSHTMTFKNKYGGAARNFRIAVYSASPAPG